MDREAARRFLTACLAPGTTGDPAVFAHVSLGSVDWPRVIRIAGNHLVTPALAGALRRAGVFPALPADVQQYLDGMQELNRARNRMLYDELIAVTRRLNGIGIEPLLLKGAIALLPQAHPGAEDRVVGDLDLLLPADRIDAASAALLDEGYRLASDQRMLPGSRERHHHATPLLHRELPVAIEFHKRLLHDVRDDARLRVGATEVGVERCGPDVRLRVPDSATRLLHNFLHTQIQDRHHAGLSTVLRPLLEFAQLREAYGAAWDWTTLQQRLRPERRRAFAVYLLAAEEAYGQPFPAGPERSIGARLWFGLMQRSRSRRTWRCALAPYRFIRFQVPRVLTLPRRLLTPKWFVLKYRAWRAGERL